MLYGWAGVGVDISPGADLHHYGIMVNGRVYHLDSDDNGALAIITDN